MSKSGNPRPFNRNEQGTNLVREYLAANPELPSRTIARHLVQKHPMVWNSVDTCRLSVLYARGMTRHKKRPKSSAAFPPSPLSKPHGTTNESLTDNPFYIPPSHNRSWTPFVITTDRDCRVLVLCDLHIPYHDVTAIRAVIREAKRRGCSKIILNGDMLDCHYLSKFCKDPGARKFPQEIEAFCAFLEMLREEFPEAEIVYKLGNHEERYERFIAEHAEILYKLREVEMRSLLHLTDLRIEYVTDKRPIKLGPHLNILHGHEYGEQIIAPVNPARGLFMKAKANAICGHMHVTSEHTEPTLNGKMITCWSVGGLCHLNPSYRPLNKWNHGAAFVELAPNGEFLVDNRKVLDGRIY